MQPGTDARFRGDVRRVHDPFESAVLSILLEQEKDILTLRKSEVR